MQLSTILLLPIVAVTALPSPDVTSASGDLAQLRDILARMELRMRTVAPRGMPIHARVAEPEPAAATATGSGLGSSLSDLGSLFDGLSETLEAACNLRQDVINVSSEFGF